MTKTEDPAFLEFAIKQVAIAAGMTGEHAQYIAEAIVFAHFQGKLNQGLGVYEAIDIALLNDVLDVAAVPECIDEGPAFAVFDGHQSSGYYTLNLMADKAIEKARNTGISIVFGGNHNDAGSFGRYVYKAYEAGLIGMASNNTVPLAAPYGGMANVLSCPPFDSIVPSKEQPPIWASLMFAEWYDAHTSEAVLTNKPLSGNWLIDPKTGELSNNVGKYARPIEGYGRVWDSSAAGQLASPRTFALNLWNEALTALVNPIGIPSHQLPTIQDFEAGRGRPSVGGSYFIAIDPAVFGPFGEFLRKTDDFVAAVKSTPPRPGQSVRMPGEPGFNRLQTQHTHVDVLEHHWQPFFNTIAGRYMLSEQILRERFAEHPDAETTRYA
jgi:LDH2 family malate/lactate/ureidoglycolate dehydrogenase